MKKKSTQKIIHEIHFLKTDLYFSKKCDHKMLKRQFLHHMERIIRSRQLESISERVSLTQPMAYSWRYRPLQYQQLRKVD
ncbi:hypothetical protein T11_6366 [Trichinella zimbabwensis]|uniref:Uncharacterized protein n=1 Tax=Trichinella zimbabwensis TaxID=268475 RepID=A0A0V1I7A6_9BILA|nr:hypothetical protein T11_6366 [Trichinella zimbabwensis]